MLHHGWGMLRDGAEALDVVVASVEILEDAPELNAGRGSVFGHDGTIEMDASIMDGATRSAGAVTGVRTVRHPVALARAVAEHTPHIMLAGAGAEPFAREQGLEVMDPAWFRTEQRWNQLQRALGRDVVVLDHDPDPDENTYGTVGAVACDAAGHIAAATSTGGMANKRPGRVGDTGVIGAGTWADDATCAVSGTGHGELFIEHHVAARVADLMELAGLSLADAAARVVHEELRGKGAGGGLIAVDAAGRITMPFNTTGMFRGAVDQDGVRVAVW